MLDGFINVEAAVPVIRLAGCKENCAQAFFLLRRAAESGVRIAVLPELCLTGATCGDLFLQEKLLHAAEEALRVLLETTAEQDVLAAVGLPVRKGGAIYNCAAVIYKGRLLGLVPKARLTAAERRWFAPAPEGEIALTFAGQETVLSAKQIFVCEALSEAHVAVEIGENPTCALAKAGATVILNPTAAPRLAGKAKWERDVLRVQSGLHHCAIASASAGQGESTTDHVYAGRCVIAENGTMLGEERIVDMVIETVDVQSLCFERRRAGYEENAEGVREVTFAMEMCETRLRRYVDVSPFLPEEAEREERFEEILRTAALGLQHRMSHACAKRAVIGLSGGLDSTLAALITARALDRIGYDRETLLCVTMPCFGTTKRTRSNAELLAEHLGAQLRTVDISESVKKHFEDIGHDMENHDVTFENAQARERTQVLMDIANQEGGMVIGTGDLSELALGWATYNGDHMSMYAVNAGIPKTLMRHLVAYEAEHADKALAAVLRDILDTPVSPELLPAVNGEISQKTEDLVGPYELHDFFLWYALRRGFSPRKVMRLAQHAFGWRYDAATLKKWLRNFYWRFFTQQFKRSCLPDGPAVGSLSLSPRGGLVMPSDAASSLWWDEACSL